MITAVFSSAPRLQLDVFGPAVLLVVLALGVWGWPAKSPKRVPGKKPGPRYSLKPRYLGAHHKDLMIALEAAVGPNFRVFPRVRLAEVFRAPIPTSRTKIIDFAICTADQTEYLALVCLRSPGTAADPVLGWAARQVGIVYLDLTLAKSYQVHLLRTRLGFLKTDGASDVPQPIQRIVGADEPLGMLSDITRPMRGSR
jgi:hypothetical protein